MHEQRHAKTHTSTQLDLYQSRTRNLTFTGPDSLVVRASASGVVGHRFGLGPSHTKGGKNGTGSSLADSRNKRVVPGRYKKAGGYLLFVMLK